MTAIAFKEGSSFNRKSLVQDVTFDVASRAEKDLASANTSLDAAPNSHIVSKDFAMDKGFLAYHQTCAVHVSLDTPVDLDITARRKCSIDHKIGTDDRGCG